ncbi:unnamed protein product [Auanema sp. JU1783]|nr:unnamed protein product [Auanema sp. JU1783]
MGTKTVFHLISFLIYAGTAYFDYGMVKGKMLPIPNQFFSKFVWLTLIDLYIQILYHFIAIFISVFGGKHPIFHFLSRAIVAPVAMTVVSLFWLLYTFDPNTLLADDLAKQMIGIVWYNNVLHTLPLITAIVDTVIWNHGHVAAPKAIKAIGVFATLYIIDIHVVHHISGFWAYPILGDLILPLRAVFIVACMSVLFMNYKITECLHTAIHGKSTHKKKAT